MPAPAPASSNPPLPWGRLAFLILAAASLLMGLDAALVRLGALAPIASADLGTVHGILMIYGFLGTAICLERAVALQSGADKPRRWAYLAPFLSGAAGLSAIVVALNEPARSLLATLPIPRFLAAHLIGFQPARMMPGFLWTLAMGVLVAIYVHVWRTRQQTVAVLIQGLGAVIGLGGSLLWLRGLEVPRIVPWWLMFLVITIIGERLELARLGFLTGGVERRILAEACAVLAGLVAMLLTPNIGFPVLGLALAALAVDTGWHDVARRTVNLPGLPRLAAVCMLTGYAWALVPSLMWVIAPPAFDGYGYDAAVHALTIGFVVSMVLAHAPVIIPAVAKREVPYHPVFWLAFGILESALVVRALAGAPSADAMRRFGGALGVMGMLVFVVATATVTVRRARATGSAGSAGSAGNARVAADSTDEIHTLSPEPTPSTHADPHDSVDQQHLTGKSVWVSSGQQPETGHNPCEATE